MTSRHSLALTVPREPAQPSLDPILRVCAVRKEFRFYRHPWDRFVEWVSGGRARRGHVFVALDNITFDVARGSAVGIIGANGAGKSTLLKIIAHTLYPTAGRVEVQGRVASLLELGMGFHPDFTGRQNIVFNARFLGLSDEEIRERMGAIVAFAELGDFIDRPLRTYSSGMHVRLAFAVVANVDPQILIVDETLAVGDAYFQQKCIRRIRQFRENGVTLLFVSHDPGAVKTLCDEALLLHHGQLFDRGRPDEVLASYNTLIAREVGSREILAVEAQRDATVETSTRRSGSFAAIVEQISLRDAQGQECRSFLAGEEVTIAVRVLCLEAIADPTVGVLIRDRLGNDVYGTNTYNQQVTTGRYQTGEVLEVVFRLALNLGPGEYTLTVAAHTLDVHLYDCFDWIDRLLVFKVLPPLSGKFIGTAFLRPEVSVRRLAGQRGGMERALAQVFGDEFPRALTVAVAGKPWLFSGWYPPEGAGEAAFCWTQPAFAVLLDLRGGCLCVEVGNDRPETRATPVQITAWLFDEPLGSLSLDEAGPWSRWSLVIPESYRLAHALVRLQVEGWCPAEFRISEDRRVLGIPVRRIWVAESEGDR